jgi:hypothetical protein
MGNGKEEDGGKVRLNPECPLTSQQPVGRLGPSCSGRGMLSRSRRHGRTCVEGCRRWHKVGGAGCHGGCVAEGRETTARPRASGLARFYTRIHALLAGERRLGRLGPWLQDCWSVSSRGSWPGSFDSGWWWVCAWRPCGVVDRCHCSPLVTRRDTTRCDAGYRGVAAGCHGHLGVGVHVPPLRRRWGWRRGLKSAVRCRQSSLSET